MCLFCLHRLPRLTLEPKKVFKYMSYDHDINGEIIVSPVQYCKYELGKEYKGKNKEFEPVFITIIKAFFSKKIKGNFFHSFIDYDSARVYTIYRTRENHKVVECEIPKFTLYYLGECGDVASRRIKFINVIK